MSIRSWIGRRLLRKQFSQASILTDFMTLFAWNPSKNSHKLIKKIRGWSYTCITKNAQACAQVPLRLYKIKGAAGTSKLKTKAISRERQKFLQTKLAERITGSDQIEEVTEHEILDLLRKVNPRQNSFELKEVTVKYLEAIGVAYWYLERGLQKKVINVYPLMSQYVRIILDKEKNLKEYEYGRTSNKQHFDPKDIIHFKYSSLSNVFVGDSPLEAGEQSVDLNEAMNLYEIASFKNGGRPSVVLEIPVDGAMTPTEIKRVESDFKRNKGGVKNTGKLFIASGGSKLKEFGFSPKEMSFTKGRQTTLEETCGVFGVPLSFVKPTEISRANMWASIDMWMNFTINPKLVMLEQKLNEQFTPNFGEGLFLLFDNARPEDPEFRMKQIESHIKTKYSSINQERAIDGLEPVEWGEKPVEPEKPDVPRETNEPDKDIEKPKTNKREGPTNDLPEPDFMPAVFRAALMVTYTEMEADIVKNLRNYGKPKAAGDDIADAAFASSADDVVSSIFDVTKWGQIISDDSMPFIRGLLTMGIADALEKIDESAQFNASSPAVLRSLEERAELIKSTATTTAKELRKDIADSIAAGESRSQAIKRVRQNFDARAKADRVVRTETIWAHNEGTVQAWLQSGVVSAKKWNTVKDDRRCPYCAAMHGKTISIEGSYFEKGESFTVTSPDSGNEITLPLEYEPVKHPPLHPGCRCQLIPILIEE